MKSTDEEISRGFFNCEKEFNFFFTFNIAEKSCVNGSKRDSLTLEQRRPRNTYECNNAVFCRMFTSEKNEKFRLNFCSHFVPLSLALHTSEVRFNKPRNVRIIVFKDFNDVV